MKTSKIIVAVILVLVLGGVIYFLFASRVPAGEIPPYVGGETRAMYEWAASSPGKELLEQVPCYCGCKFAGHLHTRHCFWRDDNTFDKHGLTCAVCFDIARKTREMHEQGMSICDIRKDVDAFYAPNVALATDTPMPAGCE